MYDFMYQLMNLWALVTLQPVIRKCYWCGKKIRVESAYFCSNACQTATLDQHKTDKEAFDRDEAAALRALAEDFGPNWREEFDRAP